MVRVARKGQNDFYFISLFVLKYFLSLFWHQSRNLNILLICAHPQKPPKVLFIAGWSPLLAAQPSYILLLPHYPGVNRHSISVSQVVSISVSARSTWTEKGQSLCKGYPWLIFLSPDFFYHIFPLIPPLIIPLQLRCDVVEARRSLSRALMIIGPRGSACWVCGGKIPFLASWPPHSGNDSLVHCSYPTINR